MAAIRTWTVKSNSYRPDYAISGTGLIEAIEHGFARITKDAMAQKPGLRIKAAVAEWRPAILRGRGGVELTIDYGAPSDASGVEDQRAVVWIHASREDLPERHEFQRPAILLA